MEGEGTGIGTGGIQRTKPLTQFSRRSGASAKDEARTLEEVQQSPHALPPSSAVSAEPHHDASESPRTPPANVASSKTASLEPWLLAGASQRVRESLTAALIIVACAHVGILEIGDLARSMVVAGLLGWPILITPQPVLAVKQVLGAIVSIWSQVQSMTVPPSAQAPVSSSSLASAAQVEQLLRVSRELLTLASSALAAPAPHLRARRRWMRHVFRSWAARALRWRCLLNVQELVSTRHRLLLQQHAFVEWLHEHQQVERSSHLAAIRASTADYSLLQAQYQQLEDAMAASNSRSAADRAFEAQELADLRAQVAALTQERGNVN